MSSHNKYAVLDLETTGFGSLDRVVEVGVVLLDEHLEVEETWDSLIQPEREIPNTFIHQITDEDVVNAPLFSGIAERLTSMVAGRTMVAHNASFEQRFLRHEFAQLGVVLP
ncbi:3'-5' exonuclease [Corynebacteriaceae bacterium 6-324]